MTDDGLKTALEASIAEPHRPGRIFPVGSHEGWPDPATVPQTTIKGARHYLVDNVPYPSVTSVLKILGLKTEGLIKWAAAEERKAVLEAVELAMRELETKPGTLFSRRLIEEKLGPARAHTRILNQAADIGTATHRGVEDWLRWTLTGGPEPSTKGVPGAALVALMAFQDWWRDSKLVAVRMEQPVYDKTREYAGTIDIVAQDAEGYLGIVDIKTSKGIYLDYHVQVAAYLGAGLNFAHLDWAKIVRLPKTLDDTGFEVKDLGDRGEYGPKIRETDLRHAFYSLLDTWKVLVGTA